VGGGIAPVEGWCVTAADSNMRSDMSDRRGVGGRNDAKKEVVIHRPSDMINSYWPGNEAKQVQ